MQELLKAEGIEAPIIMGKKTLDPNYSKRVFRQLKFKGKEIEKLLE